MTVTIVDGSVAPTTTYQDGPGNPNQGSMIWAANSFTWWYLQLQSANDTAANPGTHKISAWYNPFSSCSGDPAAGTWVYYGDSTNLDGGLCTSNSKFQNGRSLGAFYWNNSAGVNKDICHCVAALYPPPSQSGQSTGLLGNLRAVLGSSSITWGTWGFWLTAPLPTMPASGRAAMAVCMTADGYVNSVSGLWGNEDFDAAAVVSFDPDTSDAWTTGGSCTGDVLTANGTVKNMTNQTGTKVGYGLGGGNGVPDSWSSVVSKINSIDSSTQITGSSVSAGNGTGLVGWTNFTTGTRSSTIIDSSMAGESNSMALCALASNNMLAVYDDGAGTAPNWVQLNHKKASAAHPNFWVNDTGSGDGAVFAAALASQAENDWALCAVSTSAIYVAGRSGATTCVVRNYVTATNLFGAITNAPPTMTGKTIVAGGGVCLVSDGTDMWLVVIDSTDAQVKYVKYTHGGTTVNGTWGSWTNLAAAAATAAFLTCVIANGYLVAVWSEKNADTTHYDTKVASLSVGSHSPGPPTPDEDGLLYVPRYWW